MANKKTAAPSELKPKDLKWICNPDVFNFESTSDLKPIDVIVGQGRAIKSLRLGVEMKSPGYNIFVTGLSGTGKMSTIKAMLESISPECSALKDYAYVNNFNDEDRPILLVFPAGQACQFRKELNNSIKYLQEKVPQLLESESFNNIKNHVITKFGKQQQQMMAEFEETLNKEGFTIGQVKIGEVPRAEIFAVIENKPVMIPQLEEYVKSNKITKDEVDKILQKYSDYKQQMQKVFKKSMNLSQEMQDTIVKLETNEVKHLIDLTIDAIKEKFEIEKVHSYLEDVRKSIFDDLDIFKGTRASKEQVMEGVWYDYLKDYEVNIILDNTNTQECPIYIETSPTFVNLFGLVEKASDGRSGWISDFTQIKAGSLLRADNGYIVINAMDAFSETGVWKTLKRVLLYGKLEIQDISNLYQFSPSILKPEPIKLNTKVILVGNNYIYSTLSSSADDFNKIFKVKAEFDYEMDRTPEALRQYAKIIKKLVENESLLEFDNTAIAKISEYGARYAGEKDKLTTRFAYIADLTREASFWAKDNGEKLVTSYHVDQAYQYAKDRHSLYESKVNDRIESGTLLIDTKGARIGQINGLAVYGNGHYSFGKPARITASVSLGNGSIINVEREAGLSGNTHNKGVLIITGYFKETFGNNIPLSFNASIVFEQGYGMIDGDSASAAEICTMLSCLSELPINQGIAITGSVNQKGDIQPIGGVNEKIEGFFDVCKKRGLDKKQGVIIPQQNIDDLMLKDEVIEAVSKKEFHIYPVKRIEEAIEILAGIKAGDKLKSGSYETNTVFSLVEKKLKKMYLLIKPVPENTRRKKKDKGKK